MFRFSADQRHALRHGLQDFGKLTLAVLFLSSTMGMMPVKALHPQAETAISTKTQPVKASDIEQKKPSTPVKTQLKLP